MSEPAGSARTHPAGRRRSAARLAAVQALYQIELAGATPDSVIAEFAQDGLRREIEGERQEVDEGFFADLVRGAASRQGELDDLICSVLTPEWPLARLETVLRAILRAGTYELLALGDVPVPVAINEYLDIAHAFYSGKEPGLINGVLDRLARTLRPHEPAGGERDGDASAR
ncbi:MAG TPA: transcription antitermination factor NusB [Stellaceae bacterium]|nr:transcription antitermination factor NusB [Stellaceae bacterium]